MRTVTGRTDRVVIVGAGWGGLACALHLAAAGRQVTVLERDEGPGGRAGRISIAGYDFDTGPTVFTAKRRVDETFNAVGEHSGDWLDLIPLDTVTRAHFPDGSTLDVYADPERMADEVARVRGHKELLSRTRDPRTTRALGFLRLLGSNSDRPKGSKGSGSEPAYYPRGGIGAVAQALAGAAEKHGVTFRYGTAARRVEVYAGRAHAVHTTDGERIAADVVVLNPDLVVAYRDLLPNAPGPRRLDRLRHLPSCVLLQLGSPRQYSKIAHHNLHFGRAWRETLDDIEKHGRCMRDPVLLVANPTRTDPTLAPAGMHIYHVLAPVPHLQANGPTAAMWRDGLGHRYAGELIATLEARGYLDLGADLDVSRVVTPADWAAAGYSAGSPFGPARTLAQSGPLRPGNLHPRLSNVVFVGSGTRPGAGMSMVLVSGALAARRITAR